MILTTKSRYAVMAIIDMLQNDRGKPIKLQTIAARQNIPLAHLERLFLNLKKIELVKSIHGPGGGYKLLKPAKDINISEIISHLEQIKITRCSNSISCQGVKNAKCITHNLWSGLEEAILQYLSSISLEDIIAQHDQHADDKTVEDVS